MYVFSLLPAKAFPIRRPGFLFFESFPIKLWSRLLRDLSVHLSALDGFSFLRQALGPGPSFIYLFPGVDLFLLPCHSFCRAGFAPSSFVVRNAIFSASFALFSARTPSGREESSNSRPFSASVPHPFPCPSPRSSYP